MKVVVVESPAKAKTINKYLGSDYEVLASFGHVRDLPPKDGSVDPDHDFKMLWEVDDKSQKRLNDIARAVKDADGLILATDPDREGEAISWHVLAALKDMKALDSVPVKRVVFHEITKDSVKHAIANPRDLDMNLVNAQQARRALDYLETDKNVDAKRVALTGISRLGKTVLWTGAQTTSVPQVLREPA